MIELSRRKRYFFSILSGLLMVVSFPYTGSITALVFVSWIPLLLVENTIASRKYRSGKVYIHALITFLIYNLGTLWWIWNASEGGAVFAVVLNALIMAAVFQLFHFTKKYVGNKEGYIALLLFWIGFEYMHYQWELSWPWLNLGNVFSISPSIVQWYSYTGILGGSVWILLVNMLGFRILTNVKQKKESWSIQTPLFILLGLILFIPIISSLFTYYTYTDKGSPTELVVVQPNIDPYTEKFSQGIDRQLDKLFNLAETKITETTDFVIVPETAISQPFYEDELTQMGFYKTLIQHHSQWQQAALFSGASTALFFEQKNSKASRKLVGGPGYIEYYNTSMLLDTSNTVSFIHKSKLVLGVERVPFARWIPWLESLSIENGGTSGTLGIEKEPKVLFANGLPFAPVICYESIYGEFISEQCRKGAEMIFIITNDGWWKDTPGYKQHMSFSRLRAIENRRCVARSANTGISCFINQRGDVLQKTSWWEPAVIKATLLQNKEITFYTKYGDVFGRSFAFVSVLLIIFAFVKKFKHYYTK
jgi:apolipoprotein N-acyltransferase